MLLPHACTGMRRGASEAACGTRREVGHVVRQPPGGFAVCVVFASSHSVSRRGFVLLGRAKCPLNASDAAEAVDVWSKPCYARWTLKEGCIPR